MSVTEPIYHEPTLELNLEDNLELIFKKYYKLVCSTIYKLIPDYNLAEDLAQDVFCDLWRKRGHLNINTSLKAYLRKTAVNKTLNYIRKKKVITTNDDSEVLVKIESPNHNRTLEYAELQEFINRTIDKLPTKCRIIFMLSRFEEYSYKEISEELGISTKTVENQISKALKKLRKAMKSYEAQSEQSVSSVKLRSIAC